MDILNEDLKDVGLDLAPSKVISHNKTLGVWTDGAAFYDHINRNYKRVDVMTYTVRQAQLTIPIDRLIFSVNSLRKNLQCKDYKCVANLHAKMVIAYKPFKYEIYVGSLNHCAPTLIDLMVKVNNQQADLLRDFFEKVWKS